MRTQLTPPMVRSSLWMFKAYDLTRPFIKAWNSLEMRRIPRTASSTGLLADNAPGDLPQQPSVPMLSPKSHSVQFRSNPWRSFSTWVFRVCHSLAEHGGWIPITIFFPVSRELPGRRYLDSYASCALAVRLHPGVPAERSDERWL